MSFLNKAKHWLHDLWRYPKYHAVDGSYDTYWHHRDVAAVELNSFQKARVALIAQHVVRPGDTVLDIGCGDGRILAAIKRNVAVADAIGFDSSTVALEQAKAKGLSVIEGNLQDRTALPGADVILFLEVLEHVSNSEELLQWAVGHSRRAVVFSVPNTGFFLHRLRLLLGKFPLQWRAHPSEHVRFWTLTDMRWWLHELRYGHAHVYTYEGVPLLNVLWPALFAAGILVVVPRV